MPPPAFLGIDDFKLDADGFRHRGEMRIAFHVVPIARQPDSSIGAIVSYGVIGIFRYLFVEMYRVRF